MDFSSLSMHWKFIYNTTEHVLLYPKEVRDFYRMYIKDFKTELKVRYINTTVLNDNGDYGIIDDIYTEYNIIICKVKFNINNQIYIGHVNIIDLRTI